MHAIAVSMLERIQELYQDSIDWTTYRCESFDVTVAGVASRVDTDVRLLFTMGSACSDVLFVAPTTGDPSKMGDALARVEEHFARTKMRAHYGHVAAFEHPYLAERGRTGIITASPMALVACRGIPESLIIEKRNIEVVAIIWLDEEEMEIVAADGPEALEEKWSSEARDFVTI